MDGWQQLFPLKLRTFGRRCNPSLIVWRILSLEYNWLVDELRKQRLPLVTCLYRIPLHYSNLIRTWNHADRFTNHLSWEIRLLNRITH